MARTVINLGTNPNDGTGEQLRSAWSFQNDMNEELYALLSDTINAGATAYNFTGATKEQRIALADADAVLLGKSLLYIPLSLTPYDITLCPATTTVRRVIEGGNFSYFDVTAYGAQVGGTDISPAVNAAAAGAKAAGGGVVFYPPGFWYHLTTPTTLEGTTGVIFQGSGRNVTHLVMGAEGVWVFKLANATVRVQVRDMWIGTLQNFTTGGGFEAISSGYPSNQISEVILERVTFQNLPYPVWWDNVTQAGLRDVRYLQTRASATVGDAFYFIRCHSVHMADVIALGTAGSFPRDGVRIDSDCDSVFAMRCEMVLMGQNANSASWRVMDSVSAGNNPPRIIRLTDCLGENANVAFKVEAGRDVRISGCEGALQLTYGVHIHGVAISTAVVNGKWFLNEQHGIYVQSAGTGTLIEGNTCSNNSQQMNATYDGIVVAASDVRVIGNRSGDILFPSPANKQRAGLNLVAGSDHLLVSGNKLQTNLGLGFEQPILNNSTGTNNQFPGMLYVAASEALLVAGVDTQSIGHVYVTTTLTAARLVAAHNTKARGQRIVFTFIQDGTGSWAITWNAAYKHSWSDTGNTAGKRSSIAFVWDGTNWNQDGAQTPYV